MKKLLEKYQHETGITFEVKYDIPLAVEDIAKGVKTNKKLVIKPSDNMNFKEMGFVFSNSKPEMVIKIGKALTEIGEFCDNL